MITINRRKLSVLTYAYLLVPIMIFFFGWLRPVIAVFCTAFLAVGFYQIIKKEKTEIFYIVSYKMIILLSIIVLVWMFMAGNGGFFSAQRGDLHWRNATFRDLVEYSWPVIYPETGNALVYYFIFWMVPALFGKIFGFFVGNVVLFLWIFLGIFLMSIYICKSLNIKTIKEMLIFVFILITWGGLNILGQLLAYMIKGDVVGWDIYFVWTDMFTPGLQYTPNNALLEWCFNQVIVPWLVTAMFLEDEKKNIDKLAYLGLCILPYAPLPFLGIMIIFIIWGLHKMISEYKWKIKDFVYDAFSITNISAIISIVPVFYFFYSSNTAASGVSGSGGAGLFMKIQDFTFERWMILILFFWVEFLCYSVIIFREKRRSILFWSVNISLVIIPFFRIGESRDFCMRASIPALFMLMFWVIQYAIKQREKILDLKISVLIGLLAISLLGTCVDWGVSVQSMIANQKISIPADSIWTFSDKNPPDFGLNNYLTQHPERYFFFQKLAGK